MAANRDRNDDNEALEELLAPPRPIERRPEDKPDFDSINMDELCQNAGGAFRATSMMQKRLRDLVRFAPDQIVGKVDNKQLIFRVMKEIEGDALEFELAEGGPPKPPED